MESEYIRKTYKGGYHFYEGMFFMLPLSPPERVKAVLDYSDIRPDDVLVWGYPKSGNHFVSDIVRKLNNRGDLEKSVNEACDAFLEISVPDFLNYNPMAQIPKTLDDYSNLVSPRVLNTHLHYRLMPKKVQEGLCKVIYVSRNPKDAACSGFLMTNSIRAKRGAPLEIWEDYVKAFIDGKVFFGSWCDHFKDFLSVKDRPHVLWVKYENLVKDLRNEVERIHDFLGKELDADTISKICDSCTSSSAMKQYPGSVFIRKGVAGDWKNHFTDEQSAALDQRMSLELRGFEKDLDLCLS